MDVIHRSYLILSTVLIISFSSSIVYSDQFDCKDVECPPEIKCPPDSTARITYDSTRYDNDEKNSIDTDDDSENEETEQTWKPKMFLDNQNQDHQLHKRSLQYRRRESIKIVPGDYISLIPESARYHHQLNQNQHKWKRSVDDGIGDYDQSTSNTLLEKCCPKMSCVCSGNCPLPKCFKPTQVPYQREPGSDKPGACCPKFQCIDQPDCSNNTDHIHFWLTKCTKCTCFSGQRVCHKECDEDAGCYSKNLNKFFSNGISWQEDPCVQCQCNDSEPQCQTSLCKPLSCPNHIRKEGECCPVCISEITTTTLSSSTTEAQSTAVTSSTLQISTTTIANAAASLNTSTTRSSVSLTNATISIVSTSTIATSSSTPSTPSSNLSSILTTEATVLSSSTKAIESSTSSPLPSTTKTTLLQSSTQDPSTSEQPITTESIPNEVHPSVTTSFRFHDIDTIPTKNPHSHSNTGILSFSHAIDTESIILYTVIVVLVLICCMFAGLYIHEVTKRQTYLSIPNSDSNLSQMPRPKTEDLV